MLKNVGFCPIGKSDLSDNRQRHVLTELTKRHEKTSARKTFIINGVFALSVGEESYVPGYVLYVHECYIYCTLHTE